MNNILKTMYELLNREERRKKILIINFTKEKIKNAGIEKYFALAICANESEYNKVKYNIKNEPSHKYFDKITKFNSREYKEFFEKMKFDTIIGNPPYAGEGNPLYLQIAKKCVDNSEKVVWICPTQWVNTLKEVEWYDYYKNILNCESYTFVGNPFNDAVLANETAIFIFGKNKIIDLKELVYNKFKNPDLVKSIFNKTQKYIKEHDNQSIWSYNQIDYGYPYYVHNTGIRGNVDKKTAKPNWDWTTLFAEKSYTDFSKETTIFDSRQIMWNYPTIEECKNFMKYCDSDICMFLLYCVKMNNNNHRGELKYIPWLGDYTHDWPEDKLAKEFNLDENEIEYIHQEMANFGWKAKGKK